MMKGRPWAREELLRVLKLYCEITFGRMHSRNKDIIRLADKLDRTASSVSLKLVNFASLDKGHQTRGVVGMGNTSKLDREIWAEVQKDWNLVAELPVEDVSAPEFDKVWERETSALATVKVRRGQQFFRKCVLSAYDFKCALTGISSIPLLRASHIIPWYKQERTRVEPRNGICLNVLHDAAFDNGLITFDSKMRLVLSRRVKSEMPNVVFDKTFRLYEGQQIALPRRFVPQEEYLEYHRSNIFDGKS